MSADSSAYVRKLAVQLIKLNQKAQRAPLDETDAARLTDVVAELNAFLAGDALNVLTSGDHSMGRVSILI